MSERPTRRSFALEARNSLLVLGLTGCCLGVGMVAAGLDLSTPEGGAVMRGRQPGLHAPAAPAAPCRLCSVDPAQAPLPLPAPAERDSLAIERSALSVSTGALDTRDWLYITGLSARIRPRRETIPPEAWKGAELQWPHPAPTATPPSGSPALGPTQGKTPYVVLISFPPFSYILIVRQIFRRREPERTGRENGDLGKRRTPMQTVKTAARSTRHLLTGLAAVAFGLFAN
jgi:hypothetical protein